MDVSPRHAWSVWRRNATLYRRTWKFNILPNFFEPVFYLTAIGIGVGAYISEIGGMRYIEFLTPGLLAVAAMHGASFEVTYNVYVRIHFEKAYDGMLTTPVGPDDILIGEVLWSMTRSLIYGGGFFVVATLFGLVPFSGRARGAGGDSARGPAVRRNRPRLHHAHPLHRPVQLLLHPVPHAALSCSRTSSSRSANVCPGRGVIVGRGAAAAAPGAARPLGLPGRVGLGRAVGCGLHPGGLRAAARLRPPRGGEAPDELTGRADCRAQRRRVASARPNAEGETWTAPPAGSARRSSPSGRPGTPRSTRSSRR